MNKKLTLLTATLLLLIYFTPPVKVMGQTKSDTETTYTFSSKSWGASPANWSGTQDGNQFNSSGTPKGVQVCTGQSGVVVTSPKSFSKVKQVVVTYSSSSKGVGSIEVKVGTTSLGSQSIEKSKTETELTYTASNIDGTVSFTCTCTTNSYGINSIKIVEADSSTPSTYTVTYNGNGNTSGSAPVDSNSPYDNGATVTVLGNTGGLAKTHYTFGGWNTAADGSGTDYAAGDEFDISANTTLYAKWNGNTNTVTLPAPNTYGTYTMDASNPVAYGTTVELTYTPASGYESYVATWSVNGTPIVGNTFTMPDEAVTVTVSVEENTDVTYDFTSIDGFSSWGTSYSSHTVNYTEATVTFASACKQTGTITNMPVTKGQPVTIVMKSGQPNPTGVTFECQQWGSKAQTITLHYSTDGGSNYTSTGITSTNFTISSSTLPTGTNAVKITFSSTENQVGIKSATLNFSNDPIINASDIEITKDATSGEIAYSITNPDGSNLTADEKVDYDWMSSVVVDDVNSKVTFTTTANTGARREGYITLTYGELTKDVKVTQAAPTYTVTYAANGGTETMTDSNPYEVGATVTLLTNTFTAPDGYTWGSWIVKDASDNDITVTSNTFTMPASDVTVKAQWRGFGSYTLVTSTANIVPGKHYVFASSAEDGTAKAMAAQTNNNRGTVEVSISSSSFAEVSGLYEFVISGDATNKYTIYDATTPGYLYAASSGSNYLRAQTTNDANGQWTITISEGVATITAQGSYTHNLMQYNSSNKIFSCYSSAQQNVYLYMKDDDTDYEFYSNTTSSATIASTETYTVHSPATLTFSGTNNGNLIIEDGGQLIHTADVNATLQKGITAAPNWSTESTGWYTIASPVDDAPVSIATVGTYDLYFFNEGAGQWYNQKAHTGTFTAFEEGTGYLYANSANQTLSFAGSMKATNATVTVPMSYEGEKANIKGFNLVGNPFTCNLTNSDIIKIGDDDLTTYYYVAGGNEILSTTRAEREIKPGEGFLVQVAEAGQNLVFNSFSKGETATKPAYIRIEAGNESFMDRAYVQIGQGNTLRKMTINDNVSHVCVLHNGNDYAAATIEATEDEMPVNFKAAKNGTYTLTVNAQNVEMNYLHLIDNMTGADIDLLQTPSYTFDANTKDYETRFRLLFSAANGNEDDNEAPFAYFNGSEWIVYANANATLQVVDMMGRVIVSQSATNHISTNGMAQGVYVLRLLNGETVRTQKIVVR